MSDPAKPIPASTYFNRAYVALVPAMGLSYAAYNSGLWVFALLSVPFWIAGVHYLRRGSRRLREEGH